MDPFKRKLNTMSAYAGLTILQVSAEAGINRNTLETRIRHGLQGQYQQDCIAAIYRLAGPALAEDLKELEITIDYLDDNHREEQHG